MTYEDFLHKIIEDGIAGAKRDYQPGSQALEGSIAGFNACRNLSPAELGDLGIEAFEYMAAQWKDPGSNHKWFACYDAEIGFVCNMVSAYQFYQNQPPVRNCLPTANALLRVVSILFEKA